MSDETEMRPSPTETEKAIETLKRAVGNSSEGQDALQLLINEYNEAKEKSGRDYLTKLPNKESFQNTSTEALGAARRRGEKVALMVIDVNGLKPYNDSLGHLAGNDLIIRVGQALELAVQRKGLDHISRFGGDEFAVCLENTGIEGALIVAYRIQQIFQEMQAQTGIKIPASLSMGLVISSPNSPKSFDQLFHEADTALYDSKPIFKSAVNPGERPLSTLELGGIAFYEDGETFYAFRDPQQNFQTIKVT